MRYLFAVVIIVIHCNSLCQSFSGVVLNRTNDNPIEYVSIGIQNTSLSTITKYDGTYTLNYDNKLLDSIVQFSMMGYQEQAVKLSDLLSNSSKVIKLKTKDFILPEVTINSKTDYTTFGIKTRSVMSGFCGWGGSRRGKGHEIGLKMSLGKSYRRISKIHVRIHKQSFNSVTFRLHIRGLKNGLPTSDLLNENILLPVTQSSGWINFDLSSYNIIQKGDIVVTLEWLKVSDVNKTQLSRVNKSKTKTANVLISIKKNKGNLFMKRGSAAKWTNNTTQSPCIYITVSK